MARHTFRSLFALFASIRASLGLSAISHTSSSLQHQVHFHQHPIITRAKECALACVRLAAIASLVTLAGVNGVLASSGGHNGAQTVYASRMLPQRFSVPSACYSHTVRVQEHRLDGSIVPGITLLATITACPRSGGIAPDAPTLQGYWPINCGYNTGAHITYQASGFNVPTGFNGFARFYNTYIYGGNGYGDVSTSTGTYNQTIRVSLGASSYLSYNPKVELYSNDYRTATVNGGGCGT